jgi:hypothetical protein
LRSSQDWTGSSPVLEQGIKEFVSFHSKAIDLKGVVGLALIAYMEAKVLAKLVKCLAVNQQIL